MKACGDSIELVLAFITLLVNGLSAKPVCIAPGKLGTKGKGSVSP